MNQLITSLPSIDEAACNYAVLEYEMNLILKELGCPTAINETDEKTISYLYKKLETLHSQIKLLKARVKEAETRVLEYKEELDERTDAISSIGSEWDKGSEHQGSQETNIEFGHNLIYDYQPERKSQLFKLNDIDSNDEIPKLIHTQPIPTQPTNDILDMLNLKSIQPNPVKLQKLPKNSFYPMSFLYTSNLISRNYLSRDIFSKKIPREPEPPID